MGGGGGCGISSGDSPVYKLSLPLNTFHSFFSHSTLLESKKWVRLVIGWMVVEFVRLRCYRHCVSL